MTQISTVIANLFARHRIVFWYDYKCELRDEFEALLLPGIETIELKNNEFAVKHHILREKPEQKFLLYREGPPPADVDNWLLDVQLAHGEFRADQAALWLNDLGLGPEFLDLVQSHVPFFTAESRRLQLKSLLGDEETPASLRVKMLAVCTNAEPRLDEILETMLDELAEEENAKIDLIIRCGLDSFLWERLRRTFGYQSASPGMEDFAIELYKSCLMLDLGMDAVLTNDALVFLKRWKDSIAHHKAFEILSEKFSKPLQVEQLLQNQDYRKLIDLDFFRLIDQKVLTDLARNVAKRTISSSDCSSVIRQRRRGHWYPEFQHLYEAIDFAAQFLNALDGTSLAMSSFAEGIERYAQTWFRLDFYYRKVIYHVRKSGQVSVLEHLVDRVENLYCNNYLLTVNNNWQSMVDACSSWGGGSIPLQSRFYDKWVNAPFLSNKKKIYVIISDALRFEVADELLGLVRREDRYEAELAPMLSMLPSYTQLGMAALLPNQSISFSENEKGTIIVDGNPTQGTANRDKILKNAAGQAAAVRAEDLLLMNKETCRDFVRDNDVVYVYHNRIDSVGDKKESEERVFEAVEEALSDLVTIIKKLTAANATNLIVTADHGFIYQNRPIEESDFSSIEIRGKEILYRDRRFALGKGLQAQPGLKTFTAIEAGLTGDVEIQIPKSINRMRLKGSGSRYVHGGAALQEIVIPVLQINKGRESDIKKVTVEILRGSSTLITSGQITATFYQLEPVSEKIHARKLRAGIYTSSGQLISDRHELTFDLDLENARERETQVRFILTRESNQANNQEVVLRLDEQISNTTHYQEYKSMRYTMRRSFTSDFDF